MRLDAYLYNIHAITVILDLLVFPRMSLKPSLAMTKYLSNSGQKFIQHETLLQLIDFAILRAYASISISAPEAANQAITRSRPGET